MEPIKAEISQMKEKCKTVMDRGTTGTSHQQHQQGTTNHTTSHIKSGGILIAKLL